MPIHTVVKPEFAIEINRILGDLSPTQASYKTGVSDEYIRKMRQGRVPSEMIIERLASGLGVDPLPLLIAAGYKQSTDPVQAVEAALRPLPGLPDPGKEEIIAETRRIVEKYSKKKNNSES